MSGFDVDSAGHPRLLGMTFDPASFPSTSSSPECCHRPTAFSRSSTRRRGLTHLHDPVQEHPERARRSRSRRTTSRTSRASSTRTGFTTIRARRSPPSTIRAASLSSADSSSATTTPARFGEGVDAIAVNSLGHVFLLGPCRLVDPGEPPLELSGYNETPDPAQARLAEGCTHPTSPGTQSRRINRFSRSSTAAERFCMARSSPPGNTSRLCASPPTTPTARTSSARSRSTVVATS